jgi:hypothetical protein
MRSLNWRGGSPNKPCEEYEKLQRVAEDILANIDDSTSPEQFAEAQKGLLFFWQELKQRKDPLHLRPLGGHLCLDEAYLHYAMVLRNRSILQKPLPAPPAPRRQPPRSADEVVNDASSLADEVKRPGDTFLGEER